mgnify:CR=1 FL=1
MPTDIEIAQNAHLERIGHIAARAGIPDDALEPYGHYKAKVSLDWLDSQPERKDSRLVLVTAISPTPAGEGKTTLTVGLGDALNRIGRKTMICLREPSMGPVFGIKGGAAGGGHAQVVPMEDINLHFTGDFAAIGQAHNLLAAAIDNHIHHGNELDIDPTRIHWKRVMDMNDRALRSTIVGLGGHVNGQPREDGFDIVVASEVMAIFCLATSLMDLRERLGEIVFGLDRQGQPLRARQLQVHGAMAVLLRDAIKPNLVQTLENNPALLHGGPFANIAHGCNTVVATKMALSHADYVITEAGFGADLGAEKFYDIKCRKAGLQPALTVLVATAQGLKMHGGVPLDQIAEPNLEGLRAGLPNLDKHLRNLRSFGQNVVIVFNRFAADTDEEMELLRRHCEEVLEAPFVINNAYAEGGAGAEEMARIVVDAVEKTPSAPLRFAYEDSDSLRTKIEKVARHLYGAASVTFAKPALTRLRLAETLGMSHFPVCIAKTQFSFSDDPKQYGAAEGFDFLIRDVVINAGAEMIVAIAGDIMRMPGLPKAPQALNIDYINGEITGLS